MPGADRSVVVTGASTGIGRACALHLDELGYTVFAGVRRQGDADALRRRASPRLVPTRLDVTAPDSIEDAAARVEGALEGRGLGGLVNNAGLAIAFPLELVAIEDLRRQLEVNVLGQIAVTQAFLPQLRSSGGRVVNIGSVTGRLSLPFLGPYSASKFALEGLTNCLRLELRPWNIGVSMVEVGSIATPIWDKSSDEMESRYDALPGATRALYAGARERARLAMQRVSRDASPPSAVAVAVAHALASRRPKTRYRVGRLSTLSHLGSFLPDRLRDWCVMRYLRL